MFVLLFLSLFPTNSLSQSNPKICLDSICFTGSWITTNKGIKFASFQGIKYGQAPIGKLRFKSPQARNCFLKILMFFSLNHPVTEHQILNNKCQSKSFVFEKGRGLTVCFFFFKLRWQQKTLAYLWFWLLIWYLFTSWSNEKNDSAIVARLICTMRSDLEGTL